MISQSIAKLFLIAAMFFVTVGAFGRQSMKGLKVPASARIVRPTNRDAPRMVVYWSIKSTADFLQYSLNPEIRRFQGTGVFSVIII